MSKGIFTKTVGFDTQILGAVEPKISVSVVLSSALVSTADADGKKIVKAGTPVHGNLAARNTAFTAVTSTDKAVGIVLKDTDVTHGNSEAPLLVLGVVNLDRIDATTAALITDAVKTALPGITFIKD